MKKFGKFLTGSAVIAGLAAGAYYVYKNYIADNTDEVEDIDEEEDTEEPAEDAEREYIRLTPQKTDENAADLPEEPEESAPVNDPE